MHAAYALPDVIETRPAMVKIPRSRSTLVALHLIVSGLLILPTCAISAEPGARAVERPHKSAKPPRGRTRSPRKLTDRFDADKNGRLDAAERRAATEFLNEEPKNGHDRRRRHLVREYPEPPKPGIELSPAGVKNHPGKDFHDLSVIRTFFLDFENDDWEKELAAFKRTDIEVPARLTVDGRVYRDVGVHFRGASSFFTVGEGRKRSLNVSVDWIHDRQEIGGYQTLNLLNSHADPSLLRTVLSHQIYGHYIPTPKANFVRVVINGENWGIYINAQQFNKDFLEDGFGTRKGTRWKAPGKPRAHANLAYLGEDVDAYKQFYSIKSVDDLQAWRALIHLTKVLNETPADELVAALDPILDIDGTLRFLALENALINNDGYWIRTSDYNLYLDPAGRFHLVLHDANETFSRPSGPGFEAGDRIDGYELDPLLAEGDADKPLLSRLLAVPELKRRYLGYVQEIAENWLDWNKLGPIAERHHALIAHDVKIDTRKLDSNEAFEQSLSGEFEAEGPRGRERGVSLKEFADQRREYLLNHPATKGL